MFLLDPICVMTQIRPIISKTHEISLNEKDIQDGETFARYNITVRKIHFSFPCLSKSTQTHISREEAFRLFTVQYL